MLLFSDRHPVRWIFSSGPADLILLRARVAGFAQIRATLDFHDGRKIYAVTSGACKGNAKEIANVSSKKHRIFVRRGNPSWLESEQTPLLGPAEVSNPRGL